MRAPPLWVPAIMFAFVIGGSLSQKTCADSLPPDTRTIKVPCWVREYDKGYMTDNAYFPDWWVGAGFDVISTAG